MSETTVRPLGARGCGQKRCRCDRCRLARRTYEANRRRQRAYGRLAFVDADPARAHIVQLQAAGLGLRRISVLAGLSTAVTKKLVYGDPSRGQAPSRKIRPATAEAIFAVRPDADLLASGAQVDATGTRRRLQALVAAGWSNTLLAARLGLCEQNLPRILLSSRLTTAAVHRRAAALYDELWDIRPPESTSSERNAANRARGRARRNGWAPALAWDDDTIDDPAAEPHHDAVGRVDRGRTIHFDDVEFLLNTGSTIEAIAQRLGAKPVTIERYVGVIRAGTQDSWRRTRPAADLVGVA